MSNLKLINNIIPRNYQQSIYTNSLNKNTFVILPTGLGKTIIALLLILYYANKYQNKKILFLAPTKPLVEQQMISVQEKIESANNEEFITLTGLISPKKREALYEEKRFIFSTPQLIENDIVNGILNPKDICFCVFDEAHRATGNYAYTFIAQALKDNSTLLGLSASPGTSKDEILTTLQNLYIEHIEVKTYEDAQIKEHISKTKLQSIEVELSQEIHSILTLFKLAYQKRLQYLKELGYFQGKPLSHIYKRDLLELSGEIRRIIAVDEAQDEMFKAISLSAGLLKLSYAIELLESQDFLATQSYLSQLFNNANSSKAALDLTIDIHIKEGFELLSYYISKQIVHPKRQKVLQLVSSILTAKPQSKIIIFNQYRETAQLIVEELSQIKNFSPTLFVGQAKKGEVKMSQKEQKEILQKFRDDKFNILVSTSVGEEGLDIPQVDTVIFYEPIPSAIRTIQRIGRTGRFDKGSAYVLLTKGTRDIATKHIATAKEKRMYKVLKEIQREFKLVNQQINKNKDNNNNLSRGLSKFIGNTHSQESDITYGDNSFTPTIYIDVRENNDLLKELYQSTTLQVKAQKLEVGDIVLSEVTAIERKSKKDFVNSLLDKRLFPQLLELVKNYKRPLLILEGEGSIYSQRNVSDEMIRGCLCAISVDLRIPILYSSTIKDTVKFIETLTKRANKERKEHSLHTNKSSHSINQELERVVSAISSINISLSKELLKTFHSVEQLVNASIDELQKVEGIGKKRAEKIHSFLREEYRF